MITGSLQFSDRAALEQSWQVQSGDPARLNVPSPPLEGDRRNLPLQLALGQIVWEVASRMRAEALGPAGVANRLLSVSCAGGSSSVGGEPRLIIVTSLVAREALAAAFPLMPSNWYPAGIDHPLRQALCHALGLDQPTWLTTAR